MAATTISEAFGARRTTTSHNFDLRKAIPKKGRRKVGKVMREFKAGKLRSGSGGKVKSRKQALAIALSEARRNL